MDQWLEEIRAALPELVVYQQEPMKKHTTFRVGGPADLYVCPKKQELPVILGLAKKKGHAVTVIGNGSNLLVGDKGIRGLVIEVGAQMNAVEVQGNILRAQAGALLSQVAAKAAAAGLGGMEFAAGIPGSIGGAVTMNAGAYGGEMKDVIRQVTVLTPECEQKVLSREELDLSYRHSCIPKNHFLVLEAELSLTPAPEQEIRAKMAELREKRVEKQPLEYPSAGSTFKRPEGYFAGKLIMDAGLRGYAVGDAQVSEKHCGFVINRGNATAAEILQLMKDVIRQVTVLTPECEQKVLSREELDLSYRHSCIPKNHFLVLEAELSLTPAPEQEIRAKMAELREKRVEKQPLEYPSAGSTFKRPEGYFAGKLIMDAGLRGYAVGDAQVSEKHCGFVINRGNATAAEILQLMKDVQERVKKQSGVTLEPEVKMIGEF